MPGIGSKRKIAVGDGYTQAQADALFPKLTGGAAADFTAMPQVGGDPIIESGSNADGEWTRSADGTQWCQQDSTDFNFGSWGGSGSLYRSNNDFPWTYPMAFNVASVAPAVAVSISGANVFGNPDSIPSATSANARAWSGTNTASLVQDLTIGAQGRWK